MASPPPPAAIDPRRPGQYTLKIGKSLANGPGFASSSSSSSSYSRVKYNHKPNFSTGGKRTTKLTRSTNTSDASASLSIKDAESANTTSRYSYKGDRSSSSASKSKSSYILIFDPSSQSCTLEPVKNTYTFNLTSTPWETSKDKLERQYEQLGPPSGDDQREGQQEDADPDGEPDAGNPYDFRHYLNVNSKPSPSPSPALKPAGGVHTPSLSSSRPSAPSSASKPQSRPASKVDPLRQAPRKSKPTPSDAKPTAKPTPTVRLDRRASTRPGDTSLDKKTSTSTTSSKTAAASSKPPPKSDYYVHSSDSSPKAPPAPAPKQIDAEESGGLEIDWGNERPDKSRRPVHARATLDVLADSAHDGPISLHSAANSPAGRMAIPRAQHRRQKEYEADVIDFGTSDAYNSDDDDNAAAPQDEDAQMRDVGSDGDGDADGDEDVEPMDLGSPAHHQPPALLEQRKDALPDVPEDEVDFDEDDDLEAQMMAAMAEEGEDGGVGAGQESSDESEAE